MESISTDEAFKFETLRTVGFAGDAGEAIATTAQIPEGDEDAWTRAWQATAERTAARGVLPSPGPSQRPCLVCGGVKTANATVYMVDTVMMPPA